MGNFYTDVIEKDPRFDGTDRIADTALLEPSTRQRVEAIIAEAKSQGIELMIYETYRSQARQLQLFKQGAARLQNVGVHHYGLACDIVKCINSEPSTKGDFSFLGTLAKKHGLIWGGDWGDPSEKHTFPPYVHVQRCSLKDQQALFNGDWYPDQGYDPYAA